MITYLTKENFFVEVGQWHKTKWYETLEMRPFFIGMVTLHCRSSLPSNFMA